MKQYIVVEYQTGGCDYTIGCGYRVTTFEAENWDAAVDIILNKESEDYPGDFFMDECSWKPGISIVSYFRSESGATKIKLIEASALADITGLVANKQAENELKEKEAKAAAEEEAELKELERLQKKYAKKLAEK